MAHRCRSAMQAGTAVEPAESSEAAKTNPEPKPSGTKLVNQVGWFLGWLVPPSLVPVACARPSVNGGLSFRNSHPASIVLLLIPHRSCWSSSSSVRIWPIDVGAVEPTATAAGSVWFPPPLATRTRADVESARGSTASDGTQGWTTERHKRAFTVVDFRVVRIQAERAEIARRC